ncbi:MAG: hypothetical protein AB8F95_11065 [Bacteroidia bacterium]
MCKNLIISFLILLPSYSFSQVTLQLGSEFGAGWWITHTGQAGQEDKSLLNFQIGAEASAGYQFSELWEAGITTSYDRILGYYLRAAGDRVGSRDRIRIAEKESFGIQRYGVYLTAWPARTERFRMGARLGFGFFTEETIHPDKSTFQNKFWWKVHIPLSWKLGKKLWLNMGPSFLLHSIQGSGSVAGNRYTIDRLGGKVGLTFYQ